MGSEYDFKKGPNPGKLEGKSKPAEKPAGQGRLRSVRVELAENGFTVRCEHEPERSKGTAPDVYARDKEYVFENVAGVLKYIKEKLGA